ncbi:MAG: NAD(P)-dependent oxidoreductase [Solirubrobacterales bacterium]
MKVLVSGASGAIGRQIVPRLVEAGHSVTGLTTTPAKKSMLAELGAEPVVADVLDAEAVGSIVAAAAPDAIIHEATALAGDFDIRHFDRTFAVTNRLRSEGTDNLLAAGRAAGISRFIAQSFGGWSNAPAGGGLATEEDPTLAAAQRTLMGESIDAISHLEEAVGNLDWADGIVLRYGGFYGPGTGMQVQPPGPQVDAIANRKFPIIGSGSGVWSFIHVGDAADATVAALDHGAPGIYNIVDDDPAPVGEWLPKLAARIGAKPPRRIPRWLGRLAAGELAAVMMTDVQGFSNEKAKRELGWTPAHPSWRTTLAGAR